MNDRELELWTLESKALLSGHHLVQDRDYAEMSKEHLNVWSTLWSFFCLVDPQVSLNLTSDKFCHNKITAFTICDIILILWYHRGWSIKNMSSGDIAEVPITFTCPVHVNG